MKQHLKLYSLKFIVKDSSHGKQPNPPHPSGCFWSLDDTWNPLRALVLDLNAPLLIQFPTMA